MKTKGMALILTMREGVAPAPNPIQAEPAHYGAGSFAVPSFVRSPSLMKKGKIMFWNKENLRDPIFRSLMMGQCKLRSYQADAMRNIYDAMVTDHQPVTSCQPLTTDYRLRLILRDSVL